jgi:hypothetical protein
VILEDKDEVLGLVKAALVGVRGAIEDARDHIRNGGMMNAGEVPGMTAHIDRIEAMLADAERLIPVVPASPVVDESVIQNETGSVPVSTDGAAAGDSPVSE